MPNEAKKIATIKDRIAARQQKRAEVGKEAQKRVAAAWTMAKTILPNAPVNVVKKFASNLLLNETAVLVAGLKQTAKNSYYTKIAETLEKVHKIELNALFEKPEILSKLRGEVSSELKGDAKSANTKVADDRKDAGPQPKDYDEGARKEPTPMDASGSEKRKADTVDKTEGGERIEDAVQDSARAKNATGKKAGEKCEKCGAAECKCANKDASSEKEANFGSDGKHNEGLEQTKDQKTSAATKKADMGAPAVAAPAAPAAPAAGVVDGAKAEIKASKTKKADEMGLPGADTQIAPDMEPAAPGAGPLGEEPLDEGAEAAEVVQDDQKAALEEKVQEAEAAVQAIEQELNKEESEEIDVADIFNDENLEEHTSALANEHHESSDDDFFGPSASADLEASLDSPTLASIEDMFAHEASSDPMAVLFEKSAANVEGFDVIDSFGEAANHFKSEHGTKDNRDNETDHDEDILSILVEGLPEEEDGQERVKQDSTNELKKSDGAKEASKKPVLKHIKASAGAPKDAAADINSIAESLFASIDAADETEPGGRGKRR